MSKLNFSRFFRNLNRPLVYSALFLGLVFPIALIGLFSFRSTKKALTEEVLDRRPTVSILAAAVVKTRFDGLVELGTSFVERPDFRQLVAEGKWAEAINRLEDVTKEYPQVDRLFVTDLDGVIRSDFPAATPSVIGESRSGKDWYKGVSREWQPYVSEIYQSGAQPKYNVVGVAVPIRGANQRPTGVLVIQVKLETVLEWLKKMQPNQPAFIYLVDQHGNVLGLPGYRLQDNIVNLLTDPIVQKVLRGERGMEQSYNQADKEDRLSAFEPVPVYGWGVIMAEPADIAFSEVDRQLGVQLAIFGALALGGCLVAITVLFLLSGLFRYRQEEKVIMESIGDGVVAIDRQWNITLWNKVATRLTGWSEAEVMGRPLRQFAKFMRESDGSENVVFIEEAMLRGETKTMENHSVLVTKDGRRVPVGDSAAPVFDQAGLVSGAVIIFRDVSTERELAEREKAMIKLKEDFLFKTVHDLRSPSSIIKMAIDSCDKSAAGLGPQAVKSLGYVKVANDRILKLISSLLKIGQETNPQFLLECQPMAIRGVLEDVVAELAPKATAKRVTFEHGEASGLPEISGNQDALKEVFVNLLDNAIKYNKEGGQVKIGYEVVGRTVRVSVEDTGRGIPLEAVGKLFTAYFRADISKDIEGSGLGLYIVKNLVEKMGGSVAVKSTVGQGTRFTVSLPIA
ncbi:MAG: ATP-binding protein [Patescibacteria group bacterium]|nr:ATP-binding protein [Patescibacteria group bacterium]